MNQEELVQSLMSCLAKECTAVVKDRQVARSPHIDELGSIVLDEDLMQDAFYRGFDTWGVENFKDFGTLDRNLQKSFRDFTSALWEESEYRLTLAMLAGKHSNSDVETLLIDTLQRSFESSKVRPFWKRIIDTVLRRKPGIGVKINEFVASRKVQHITKSATPFQGKVGNNTRSSRGRG